MATDLFDLVAVIVATTRQHHVVGHSKVVHELSMFNEPFKLLPFLVESSSCPKSFVSELIFCGNVRGQPMVKW